MKTVVLAYGKTAKFYTLMGLDVHCVTPSRNCIKDTLYSFLRDKTHPFILIQSELYDIWTDCLNEHDDMKDALIWSELAGISHRKTGEQLRKDIRNLTGIS